MVDVLLVTHRYDRLARFVLHRQLGEFGLLSPPSCYCESCVLAFDVMLEESVFVTENEET